MAISFGNFSIMTLPTPTLQTLISWGKRILELGQPRVWSGINLLYLRNSVQHGTWNFQSGT